MEAGIGVNSPEFLQKKIERLKTALDEANVLMDRQVTERDEARAQLDVVKREREELQREREQLHRELEELRQQVAAAPEPADEEEQPTGLDPELEQSLREQIAQLEGERDSLAGERDALRGERDSLAGERDSLAGERDALRGERDSLAGERDTLRGERDSLAGERDSLRAAAADADATPPPPPPPAPEPARDPEAERELRERAESLQRELDTAMRDLATAKSDLENARAAADSARRESQQAQQTIAAGAQRRPMSDGDLPAPGPFVSQEVIRDALDNDNFVLFCQPVFSLQAERITQYELLLRLRDADGRMVRPFSFLEPADRFGLMGEIDRWVVQHALDLLERDVSGELRLEVNIASQSLGDFELTELIEQHIAMTDLDPGRLILEVSENVAAASLEDAQRLAKRLRGLGCGFALDDFGSTFASFRHLRELPINYLKIDGDLVVTVTESRTGQLTIKSLVELAKGLGAETIAEYVSDDQTLEFLREQGVGYAQGYRIGRPRPVEEVLNMDGSIHEHQPQPPKRVQRPELQSGGEDDGPAEEDRGEQEHAESEQY